MVIAQFNHGDNTINHAIRQQLYDFIDIKMKAIKLIPSALVIAGNKW